MKICDYSMIEFLEDFSFLLLSSNYRYFYNILHLNLNCENSIKEIMIILILLRF